MRYRRLSASGDMVFGNQQNDFHRDTPDGVAQAVLTRLRLWKTEWFIDIDEGTPYQQAALGTGKRDVISPALRGRILETQGVTEIQSFELLIDAEIRTATITATLATLYGVITFSEII